MLFLTTVTSWRGIGRETHVVNKITGTQYVLNINNVINLKAEGSGSMFNYLTSLSNIRTGFAEVHCTTPYLTVKQEYDIAPTSNILSLTIFPNNNLSKPTYSTYIPTADLIYAWSHNPYPQYSWVIYSDRGFGEKRVLVEMTLSDIVAVDNQFDENNTQWFHFVDPLEEIHPTWFIRV